MDKGENTDFKELFYRLYKTIKHLRGPEGCPWDRKQTAHSLREGIVEEAFECVNAINNNDDENLKEELGDLFLVILLIIAVKEEEGAFYSHEVANGIIEKIIRRHPHVFKNKEDITSDEVVRQWDEIKESEKKDKKYSILDRITHSHHPVETASLIQKTVAKAGFDWKDMEPLWDKLHEEIDELKEALKMGHFPDSEMELGDLLFTIINIARLLKINPAIALNATNRKFVKRFKTMEGEMKKRNLELNPDNLETMDAIWNEIKNTEKNITQEG